MTLLEKLKEIERLIGGARVAARRVGPMHSAWDVISDANALLAGRRSIMDEDQILAALREYDRDR